MAGINKVILVGNTGNVDIKDTQFGDKVVNISVATSVKYKDKAGNQVEQTEWHHVVLFKKLAEIAAKYISKGAKIYIEGSLKTEKWQDNQGNDRYTTKIIARDMQMLGSKNDTKSAQPGESNETQYDYAKVKDEGVPLEDPPF